MKRTLARAVALAALSLAPLAQAQQAPAAATIAVLSLVGDRLDIVGYTPQVGSLLEKNEHTIVPVTDGSFDLVLLRAAKAALAKARPGADIALLAASKPESFAAQSSLFDGDRVRLPEEIDTAVRREHASRLVLVTRYRSDARLALQDGTTGSGKLEGLGFYVDNSHWLTNSDTNETARGLLAPFAYLRISLVDVETGHVIEQRIVTRSTTLGAAGNTKESHAWDILTAAQKAEILNDMLRQAVSESIPAMFGAPAAPAHE